MIPDKKTTEGVEIENNEGYGSGDVGGIKEIILRQLSKCITEGSKEMCRAGVRERIINGEVIQVAVPNQREILINNIEMLWNLVLPKVQENQDLMNKQLGDFNQQLKDIQNRYKKKIATVYEYKKIDDLNHPFSLFNSPERNSELNQRLQLAEEETELERLTLYQKKLTAISFLLNKLNYFEEGGT